jgi:hypothetical protein
MRAALLRALGGIAAKGPQLGTDPFGSFQAGIRGSFDVGAEQEAAQAARAQQDEMNRYRQAEAQAAIDRAQRAAPGYAQRPWYMDPSVDPALRDQYQADALYHPQAATHDQQDWMVPASTPYAANPDEPNVAPPPQMVLPPFLQGVPPAARATAAAQFYEQMYATKPQPKQMSPWQTAQVHAWRSQHPGSSIDDALAALTYNAPVQTTRMVQARGAFNAPLWIDVRTRRATETPDWTTAKYEPYMISIPIEYGSRFGDQARGSGARMDSIPSPPPFGGSRLQNDPLGIRNGLPSPSDFDSKAPVDPRLGF